MLRLKQDGFCSDPPIHLNTKQHSADSILIALISSETGGIAVSKWFLQLLLVNNETTPMSCCSEKTQLPLSVHGKLDICPPCHTHVGSTQSQLHTLAATRQRQQQHDIQFVPLFAVDEILS